MIRFILHPSAFCLSLKPRAHTSRCDEKHAAKNEDVQKDEDGNDKPVTIGHSASSENNPSPPAPLPTGEGRFSCLVVSEPLMGDSLKIVTGAP